MVNLILLNLHLYVTQDEMLKIKGYMIFNLMSSIHKANGQ